MPTKNLEAYEYFLPGIQLHDKDTTESIHSAMKYLKTSVAIDPEFSEAYARLAYCYVILAFKGSLRPVEAYPEMLRLAQQVPELENLSGYRYEFMKKH